MTKTRVASVGGAPKSKIEIIHDRAIKEHAKHLELIEEIERITAEFQKLLSGGVLDLHAALEQFERKIKRIGTHSPIPSKARPKAPPSPKTVPRRIGGPQKTTSWVKKQQSRVKRPTRKRIGGK